MSLIGHVSACLHRCARACDQPACGYGCQSTERVHVQNAGRRISARTRPWLTNVGRCVKLISLLRGRGRARLHARMVRCTDRCTADPLAGAPVARAPRVEHDTVNNNKAANACMDHGCMACMHGRRGGPCMPAWQWRHGRGMQGFNQCRQQGHKECLIE